MRIQFLIPTIAFVVISCSKAPVVVTTYDSGKPKTQKTVISEKDSTALFEELYESGKVKIVGQLRNEKRHGEWKSYYESGKTWSIGEYNNGERNGSSIVYTDQGTLMMTGYYKNGKVDSTWVTYKSDGDTLQLTIFKDGNMVSSYSKSNTAPLK